MTAGGPERDNGPARRRPSLPVVAVGLGLLAGLGAYSAVVASMTGPPTSTQRWWLLLAVAVAAVLGFLTAMAGGYWLGSPGPDPTGSGGPLGRAVVMLWSRPVAALLGAIAVVALVLLAVRPDPLFNPARRDTSGISTSETELDEPLPAVSSDRARLTASPQRPGACSTTVTLEGEVLEAPPQDVTLWLLSVRHADRAAGLDHALHFAKTTIPAQAGPFRIEQEPSSAPGERWGRWLLVAADAEAHAELMANRRDAETGDRSYPDERRIQLPAGAETLAESAELVQRC